MSILPIVPAVIGLAQPVQAVAKSAVSSFASVLENLTGSSEEPSDDTASDSESLHRSENSLHGGLESPLTLGSIGAQTEAALRQLHTKLKSLFETSGIDPLQTARLSVQAGDGRVAVSIDHPQAQQIEELINSDPELANSLRQVFANLEILRAAEKHQEFAAAYERDPASALAQFSELFDKRNRSPLDLLFDIQGLEPDALS